jgi:hypothetical protein
LQKLRTDDITFCKITVCKHIVTPALVRRKVMMIIKQVRHASTLTGCIFRLYIKFTCMSIPNIPNPLCLLNGKCIALTSSLGSVAPCISDNSGVTDCSDALVVSLTQNINP